MAEQQPTEHDQAIIDFLNQPLDAFGAALLASGVVDAAERMLADRPPIIEEIARVRTEG